MISSVQAVSSYPERMNSIFQRVSNVVCLKNIENNVFLKKKLRSYIYHLISICAHVWSEAYLIFVLCKEINYFTV